MDLYSRKVIGWELSSSRTVALTLSALKHALKNRSVTSRTIFHSDRGAEYGAHAYQSVLRRCGILASMNRPGCMNDNVYVETFFQTLKTESFKGLEFESASELRRVLSWYIDEYYNKSRRHGALRYTSPCQYEKTMA